MKHWHFTGVALLAIASMAKAQTPDTYIQFKQYDGNSMVNTGRLLEDNCSTEQDGYLCDLTFQRRLHISGGYQGLLKFKKTGIVTGILGPEEEQYGLTTGGTQFNRGLLDNSPFSPSWGGFEPGLHPTLNLLSWDSDTPVSHRAESKFFPADIHMAFQENGSIGHEIHITPQTITITDHSSTGDPTEITGTSITTGKVITKTWDINTPDYVFEPDYKLPGLREVETYVKKHKHLPEIPSGEQLEKRGMDLAAMNILLLKKVEELTLYTIKQEKRIEKLEALIKE